MANNELKFSIGDRMLGGLGGFVAGGVIGVLAVIVVRKVTDGAVALGLRDSVVTGAVVGLVAGVAFPLLGKGLGYLMSLI